MRRRDLLATTGLAFLAGCQDMPAEPTDTPTEAPTESPTATGTPEPPAPTIETVSLVSVWDEFGDLDANAIDTAAPIPNLKLALRYTMPVHDGAINVRTQMTVYDEDDSRVDMQSETEEILTDDSGVPTWENDLVFDAADWDHGEYTVETIVRDNTTDKTSDTATATFELTEPITDAEVTNLDAPSEISVGEAYQATLTIENTSGRDGTFESTVSIRSTGDFEQAGGFRLTLADGQAREFTSNEITFPNSGEVVYRLDATGYEWFLSVNE